MKEYMKLIRIKHYTKNLLIFLPIIFSRNLWEVDLLTNVIIGFVLFCLTASIVYIFNDIKDVESDKLHPQKCKRPIASGKITKKQAFFMIIMLALATIGIALTKFANKLEIICILLIYVGINIAYTIKLKKIPIVDIFILAMGFLIRVIFGATLISVQVSNWLYLTILSISFYMGMGKRRNEMIKVSDNEETREVLKYYNKNFLNENMYMFLALAIVFYSLWCVDMSNKFQYIMYTIPLIMFLAMQYSLVIEKGTHGDPVEVILENKKLVIGILLSIALIIVLIYV